MAHDQRKTYSHVIADSMPNILDTSNAALSDDGSVFDLGWNQDPDHDARPWIKGLHNEDAWVLIRRLNKVALPPNQLNVQQKLSVNRKSMN